MALSLEPVLKNHGVDVLALGCTHYSLVTPAIKKVIAPDIQIIDSSMVIIKQSSNAHFSPAGLTEGKSSLSVCGKNIADVNASKKRLSADSSI